MSIDASNPEDYVYVDPTAVDSTAEGFVPEPSFPGEKIEQMVRAAKIRFEWPGGSGIFTQENSFIPAEHQMSVPDWESGLVDAFNLETNQWEQIPTDDSITRCELVK